MATGQVPIVTGYNRPMTEKQPRPLDPEARTDDRVDNALRPQKMDDLIGQDQVKENLAILIAAALQRGEPLDHVLFYGPPGLGKTTLAHVVANEMGVNIKITSGPAIERAGDLAAILTNLAGRRCAVHRRNPPAGAGGGGSALPCHGGFFSGYRHRQRVHRHARSA